MRAPFGQSPQIGSCSTVSLEGSARHLNRRGIHIHTHGKGFTNGPAGTDRVSRAKAGCRFSPALDDQQVPGLGRLVPTRARGCREVAVERFKVR